MNHHKKKQSQEKLRAKITGIALGTFMIVSFVVIGLEVIHKPSQLEAFSETAPRIEEFETQNFVELRELNRQQAKKIKKLNEELLEATRKIHELRASLFARTSPQDKAKIADLTEELRDKEVAVEALRSRLSFFEEKAEKERRQILRLEQTQEALALMNEKDRAAKDAIVKEFQDKIDRFNEEFDQEKTKLLSEVVRLQESEETLKQTLSKKETLISTIEQELFETKNLQEEGALAQKEIKTFFDNQVQDLLQVLEKEREKNQSLSLELASSQASERAQLDYAKEIQQALHSMEDELNQAKVIAEKEKNDLTAEVHELNKLVESHIDFNQTLDQKYQQLEALLGDEEGRVKQFVDNLNNAQGENELLTTQIAMLELALQDYTTQATDLEHLAKEHQREIENRQQQIEQLSLSNDEYTLTLQSEIEKLQQELTFKEEKTNSLLSRNESQEMCLDKLEEEKTTLEERVEKQTIEMNQMQNELQTIMEEMSALQNGRNHEMIEKNTLAEELLTKQNSIDFLQEEINSLKEQIELTNTNSQQIIQDLEETLKLERDNMSQLEQQLAEEKTLQNELINGQQQIQEHFFSLNDIIESQEAKLQKIHQEHLTVTHEKEELSEEVISLRTELATQKEKFQRIKNRSISTIAETSSPVQGKSYVTEPGDTLQSISFKFYGTQDKWLDIFEINRALIDDFNEINSGITLILPTEGLLSEEHG